eukprot:SAG31_NODE_3105_length_4668_cov_1.437733_4_plen_41_part_00
MGKHKPMFDPSVMMGDHVIIVNCKEVAVRTCCRRLTISCP